MKYLLLGLTLINTLQGDPIPDDSTKPSVITLGELVIHPQERSITFPVYANLEEGILEFALVQQKGKIHEALFITEIDAAQLNTGLRLLGLKANDSNQQEIPTLKKLNHLPAITIELTRDLKHYTPLSEFISYARAQNTPFKDRWVYNGSFFFENRFLAQEQGDLIAIYTCSFALVNLNHPDSGDDTLWTVHETNNFPYGTSLTMRITLED